MSDRAVVLDSGPLGLLAHPRLRAAIESRVAEWIEAEIAVVVPEIAYYEVRRELVRLGSQIQLERLDELTRDLVYAAITTPIIIRATGLWAAVRQQGRPTADPKALDGGVILAATAIEISESGTQVVVASGNVAHLSRFVVARNWIEIPTGIWDWAQG